MLLELLATFAAALFAGAAVYINVVEHPARMSLGPGAALAEWRPSYQRATLMQAPLAIIGCLSALGAWLQGASEAWLVGGLLLGAIIPITLIVIFPTNKQLLALAAEQDLDRTRILLGRWNRLHAIRSLLSLAALVLFLLQFA